MPRTSQRRRNHAAIDIILTQVQEAPEIAGGLSQIDTPLQLRCILSNAMDLPKAAEVHELPLELQKWANRTAEVWSEQASYEDNYRFEIPGEEEIALPIYLDGSGDDAEDGAQEGADDSEPEGEEEAAPPPEEKKKPASRKRKTAAKPEQPEVEEQELAQPDNLMDLVTPPLKQYEEMRGAQIMAAAAEAWVKGPQGSRPTKAQVLAAHETACAKLDVEPLDLSEHDISMTEITRVGHFLGYMARANRLKVESLHALFGTMNSKEVS